MKMTLKEAEASAARPSMVAFHSMVNAMGDWDNWVETVAVLIFLLGGGGFVLGYLIGFWACVTISR